MQEDGCSSGEPISFVKKLHFSFGFFDSEMPKAIADHVRAMTEDNPDFDVIVWGPTQSRDLIKEFYPAYLKKYDSFRIPIQRSDASRYAILHRHGGVYADLDYDFKKPLAVVLQVAFSLKGASTADGGRMPTNAFVNETPNATSLRRRASNSLMGARAPGHPFWLVVMDTVNQGMGFTKHQRIMTSAGPQAVDRALARWREAHNNSTYDVVLLPKHVFNPCSVCNRNALAAAKHPQVLAVHNNGGTWHTPAGSFMNTCFCDWPWLVTVIILVALVVAFATLWGVQMQARRRASNRVS
jgi:mannosyltransferase OCH1-like enzyme